MADAAALPVFYQVAALLVLAAGVGLVGILLRQPLIVAFILVGLLAGPVVGISGEPEYIQLLAELGVALLLFLVGLKLDVGLIRTIGPVAAATGLGQVGFTAGIGFFICLALGLDLVTSAYVAVALTFSSTIIIVKLLSDKGEIGSLHGRVALGFLIVQDIVVVLAMVVLSAVGVGAAAEAAHASPLMVVVYGVALIAGVGLFIRYLAGPLTEWLARSSELMVCFAIGWAAFLAALGDFAGFGKELGGLLAGVSLASTQYREAMSARLSSLRDFLLLFFFIALGARLELDIIGAQVGPAIILSLFVLIGNPLIVVAIMGAMGYRRRTGFLAGLTVAQISEFSLIFMAMGVTLGHVAADALGLVTIVGLVTIAASVYMITWSHQLYSAVEPLLRPFERVVPFREVAHEGAEDVPPCDVILFGLGRYGGAITQRLTARGRRVLGVDFSPAAIRRWRDEGLPAIYGDIGDPEFIAKLPLDQVQWVVAAVPEHDLGLTHGDPRLTLIQTLREHGYRGRIAVAAQQPHHVGRLTAVGADLVFLPFQDAADQAVDLMLGERRHPRIEVIEPEEQKELAS